MRAKASSSIGIVLVILLSHLTLGCESAPFRWEFVGRWRAHGCDFCGFRGLSSHDGWLTWAEGSDIWGYQPATGRTERLHSAPAQIRNFDIEDGRVAWVDFDGHAYHAPLGSDDSSFVEFADDLMGVLITRDHLYGTSYTRESGVTGRRYPLAGGAPEEIGVWGSSTRDGDLVCWTTPRRLRCEQTGQLVIDTAINKNTETLAIGGDTVWLGHAMVYVDGVGRTGIDCVDIGTGTIEEGVVKGRHRALSMAATPTHLYWSSDYEFGAYDLESREVEVQEDPWLGRIGVVDGDIYISYMDLEIKLWRLRRLRQ